MITEEIITAPEVSPEYRPADPQPPASSPGARLWRNRNFNIFWAGQGLSGVGDAFAILALPLLVLQATGSLVQMGLVTGTYGVGEMLAGLFSGTIVDRVDRRRLMLGCDIARTLLYSSIPLAWWLVGPQLWLIYVVAALGAMLGNVFQVGSITAVANLVDKDQLTDANGRLQTSFGMAFFVGPMLAGLVSHAFGPAVAVGVDAMSFSVSAVSLIFVRLRLTDERKARGTGEHVEGKLDELLAGFKFLWRQPVLRSLTAMLFILSLIGSAGLDLYVFHLKHNLGQDDSAIGLLLGASSIGGIASSLVAARLRRRWGYAACWLGGCFVQAVALIIIGISPTLLVIFSMSVILNAGGTVYSIMSMSFRQEITPDRLLGRVTAAFWTLSFLSGPLGAAGMTAIAARTGVPFVFLLMGLISIATSFIALFTPIRTGMVSRAEHPSEA